MRPAVPGTGSARDDGCESRNRYNILCIPIWYRSRMSTQIAVRLPDEIVAFLDGEIEAGRAKSRAQVVLRALEREHRRQLASRDAEILADSSAAVQDVQDVQEVNIAAAHGEKA